MLSYLAALFPGPAWVWWILFSILFIVLCVYLMLNWFPVWDAMFLPDVPTVGSE